ncbi:MAG: hypothetical protein K0U37_08765 [Gammaproteobacteria bacterium]|nr:hypothetical protein [Gammaproteobacteria bacterium]
MGHGVSVENSEKIPVRGGGYSPLNSFPTTPTSSNRQVFFGGRLGEALAEELGFEFRALKLHAKAFLEHINMPPVSEKELQDLKVRGEVPVDDTQYQAACAEIKQYEHESSAEAMAKYGEAFNVISEHKETLEAAAAYQAGLVSLEKYRKMLTALKEWVAARRAEGINLQPKHLNAAVRSIELQRALPERCSILFETYLDLGVIPVNFEEVIHDVSNTNALKLPDLAKLRRQLHHSLPHALEIEHRTMRLLKELGIWQADTERDKFLLSITSCIVLLHDYVQKISDKSQYESNEEATAAQVSDWLVSVLGIPETNASSAQDNVKKIIELMAHRMIVGGTTVLFDSNMTTSIDLIDFIPVLEKSMTENAGIIVDSSNQTLLHELNNVSKAIGVNDKTPGAVLVNMVEQARDVSLATVPLVQANCPHGASRLKAFFSSTYFTPYYDDEALLRTYYTEKDAELCGDENGFFKAVNQQTFCTHIAPHISMPAEFLAADNENQIKLYQFIDRCRESYSTLPDATEFSAVFEAAFEECNMMTVLHNVFFTGIKRERSFSATQIGPLETRESDLRSEGVDTSEVHRFVDATVPLKDGANLTGLKTFFDTSSPVNQKALCKELLMAVVLQAGQVLAVRLQSLSREAEERAVNEADPTEMPVLGVR